MFGNMDNFNFGCQYLACNNVNPHDSLRNVNAIICHTSPRLPLTKSKYYENRHFFCVKFTKFVISTNSLDQLFVSRMFNQSFRTYIFLLHVMSIKNSTKYPILVSYHSTFLVLIIFPPTPDLTCD